MNRRWIASIAGLALVVAAAVAAIGQVSVLNYFSQPTSTTNDNVLTIGGTFNVVSGGVVQFGGVATNIKQGVIALDGSNPTSVQTGFTTISSCTANINTSTAPGLNTSTITVNFSTGQLDLYAWKPTGGASPNLTASTATENVAYVCFGG